MLVALEGLTVAVSWAVIPAAFRINASGDTETEATLALDDKVPLMVICASEDE